MYKGDNVTVGTGNKTIGTNPDTQVVLDQFYKINKETLGEFLRLEYNRFSKIQNMAMLILEKFQFHLVVGSQTMKEINMIHQVFISTIN